MTEPASSHDSDSMTLTEHLGELRVRIIRSVLAIVIGGVVVMIFYNQVLRFLLQPYIDLCARQDPEFCGLSVAGDGDVRLFVFDPLEGFSTRLRLSLYGGIILALPVLMWQIWRFVVPALNPNEKKYAIPFVVSSVLLFALGGLLAYITLERALEFLINVSGQDVEQAFQVSRYVRLVTLMIAAFGVGFLFPVLLVFLQLVGVLTPQILLKGWRYAIVAVFVLAAVITPSGDPFSLLALSLPMVALYFVAIFIGWIAQRTARRRAAAAA
jgi:sec-independent protein translocase protein TatC